MNLEDIEKRFTYHAPTEGTALRHAAIRRSCMDLAFVLNDLLPEGREKSLAITHLEEVAMWSNASIARS